ncbi:MAG TPA: type II secretion system F family protein [Kineosporiaceae bacterium]|nr:type II secretion system F family protein [Kineosporiaceae bacterium]
MTGGWTSTAAAGGPLFLGLALALFFAGLTVLILFVLGLLTRAQRPEEQIRRRLSAYTVTGRPAARRQPVPAQQHGSIGDSMVARSAVGLAERVMERRGLDTVVDARLEAAGLPLRTAEWGLIHLGTAVGMAVLLLLLSAGSLAATVFGLFIGLVGPWLFLAIHQGRRETRFLTQLPDALQLLAGSLQAGYSLPQALDTVVREGEAPMSAEFNRALIESRLGLPVEDALEGIANRMANRDFSWVVMAIRVQREVGGNLAELLNTVADTLRERERLRRQVRALSSEGRLSGWILGLLPVVFATYLVVVKPEYVQVLWTTPLGWLMLVTALVLLTTGAFWMTRAVKVEV